MNKDWDDIGIEPTDRKNENHWIEMGWNPRPTYRDFCKIKKKKDNIYEIMLKVFYCPEPDEDLVIGLRKILDSKNVGFKFIVWESTPITRQ